jgi:NADH:ubiquinone oxidoreductase subunit 6 (subunit J)
MADDAPSLTADIKWGAAVMLVVILATAVVNAGINQDLWTDEPQGRESMNQYEGPDGQTRNGITEEIFEDYVVAFEILGVLLLASLVGAIVIAVREENL